jgi:O-antigen/teichoic acid export membrane protein
VASALKKLLVQTSHYSLASLFSVIAGLVTFPLLTRIFSVTDYVVMNLVAATLSIAVAVGKMGVQHSIVRYQSEITAGKRSFTLGQLYSTTVIGMAATGFVVAASLGVTAQIVPEKWLADPRLRLLFAIAALVVLAQVLESAFVNFLRAEQNTTAMVKYQVAKKYLGLGILVVALLGVSRTLTAFYSATAITEVAAMCMLAWVLFRTGERPRPTQAQFSRPLFKELLGFGIPMMIGYEMSGIVLAVGDRYVIEGMIGQEPLGLYSAAYNLCQYVQQVVIASVGQAIMPIYMQMWDQKGKEETAQFIARSLRTYVLFGAPVIAGLASVGPELLPSLASDKYASAAAILPWVIAGMVVDGTNTMVGAGLFIHRKTRTIMSIVIVCAAINIGLNLLLVPRIGILGSAIATLVSYSVTSLAMGVAAERLLHVPMPWGTLLRSGAAAAIMYLSLMYILPGHRFLTVGVRAAVGGMVYAAIIVLVDPDARELANKVTSRLRRRSG